MKFQLQTMKLIFLAGIVPPSGPSSVIAPQPGFSAPMYQQPLPGATVYEGFNTNAVSTMPIASNKHPQALQISTGTFYSQAGSPSPFTSNVLAQTQGGLSSHFDNGNLLPYAAPAVPQDVNHSTTGAGLTPQLNNGQYLPRQNSGSPVASQVAFQNPSGPGPQQNNDVLGGTYSQGPSNPVTTQAGPPSIAGPLALVSQPPKDKFETKSTVWVDTLSRGLVNLNISGPKTNPLADIGVYFDAINRKEKRMEKQTVPAFMSTVTMGEAMGSGSGIGQAGTTALRAPPNPMIGSGMGMMGMRMGMGVGLSSGMNMGGYGGMNHPMGMGMGTIMNV